MKKKITIALFLLLYVTAKSQSLCRASFYTINALANKPTHLIDINSHNTKLIYSGSDYSIISKNKQQKLETKRERKFPLLFHKVFYSIFNKKEFSKTKRTNNNLEFYCQKTKREAKGLHLIEGLFTYTPSKLKPFKDIFENYALSLKVLYGYELKLDNVYISSYPAAGISAIRSPEKKTLLANTLKDFVPGIKINIDFNL